MTQIIPAIMPDNYDDLKHKISKVVDVVPLVQIDVMDGRFVSSSSWPYNGNDGHFDRMTLQNEGLPYWEKLDFEIDLMVSEPDEEAHKWINAGATRLIFHIESLKNVPKDFIKNLKEEEVVEIGMAIGVNTPNEELDNYLEYADVIQFMGIERVGYQGENFSEKVLEKIKDFYAKNPKIPISVDGAVNFKTVPKLVEAGATRLVSGSTLFSAPNMKEAIETMKTI